MEVLYEREALFREADVNDLEGIIKLCNQCFDEDTDINYAKKVFLANRNDPNQIYLIGIMDDEIIAHTKITIIPTIYREMGTYAIVNHVCVREDVRRHNIASQMLDKVFLICKNKNCKKVELWSNNSRQPAHSCYKKNGFFVVDAKFFAKELS